MFDGLETAPVVREWVWVEMTRFRRLTDAVTRDEPVRDDDCAVLRARKGLSGKQQDETWKFSFGTSVFLALMGGRFKWLSE
jgi:hypothetical protein